MIFPQFQHLDEEIEHLAPDNLRAFDAKELDAMFDKLVHYAHTHDSPFVVLPFMLRSVQLLPASNHILELRVV